MTAVFILVNGEDWVVVAQDMIIAYGAGNKIKEGVTIIYFVIVTLIGNMTLLALFTGMLLHSFQQF